MSDSTLAIAPVRPWRTSLQQPPDLEHIFNSYVDPVYRFVYSRVGNREDAEDLTSEVFLKAAGQLDPERPEASIAQWLFTVARTVIADHWRRYYRRGPSLPLDENQAEVPVEDDDATGERAARLVLGVLAALPERYRRVLELRFLSGYSVAETARELGLSPENVKVIQHRALAKAVQVTEGRP
ncbi:MAG: RNA polymerase sigma factor [Chloroflexota bacterium]